MIGLNEGGFDCFVSIRRFDECCFEAGFVDEGAPLCEDVNVTDVCLDQGELYLTMFVYYETAC